jgi:alpha-1,3-mannosyltransferase
MRVLQVARQFYPKVGGIESCVLNLSRGLVGRGHHVEVVTLNRDLRTGDRLDSPASIDSIAIHRIPYFGSRRYPVAPTWLRCIEDFDVVHIHAIDFFIDSGAVAKRLGLHRKPIVVTTHGGIFHTSALRAVKDLYWRNVLRRSLREVAVVVAVSERDAQLFRSIVPEGKLVTIPNGIDSVFSGARYPVPGTRNSPAESQQLTVTGKVRRRLLCVGRVSKAKGVDKVIQLIALLANDFPDVELIVAGPDESGMANALRTLSESLGLGSRVQIVGELPIEQLAALVASSHLFISAAPHEGFGITTVEALSAGVPVLVTRTGVHEQIVQPGVNGWFWSGRPDPKAAATLREALLLPDARLAEMRLAARASAAPFDWNSTTDRYERVLESAYRESLR